MGFCCLYIKSVLYIKLLLFYLSALLLHLCVTMSSIPGSSSNEEDINKPLWKYVTKFEKLNEGGGNITVVHWYLDFYLFDC